ncbi:MAG: hypothetical protein KME17_30520 [Cyanosarcina radialis HA8281-LM2]|jgi:hypothetical protein|nr:hypothetical protein [Cyanosarcina radialis HA8281-LM2]
MSPIESLTPEQEALIETYRDRWRRVILCTTPIDRSSAETGVKAAYAAIGKPAPEIWFVSGPQAARDLLREKTIPQLMQQLGIPLWPFPLAGNLSRDLRSQLSEELLSNLVQQLHSLELNTLSFQIHTSIWNPLAEIFPQNQTVEIDPEIWGELSEQMLSRYWEQQQTQWRQQLRQQPGGDWLVQLGDTLWQWGQPLGQFVEDNVWQPLKSQSAIAEWERGWRQMLGTFSMVGLGWNAIVDLAEGLNFHPLLLDFCYSVLHCHHDPAQWQAWRSLVTDCGLVLTFEKGCLVFDRPLEISIDANDRLHGEGRPAIKFADGYSVYAYQGVTLPEKYGRLHPNQWEARWLLEEENAELRRVLIQGIGYSRICQELDAKELDSWREYTLLEIVQNVDVEPIHLLKMTCPSTGYIHASRVPPDIQSAREAVSWINWGVDPEEFAVET